MKTALKSLLVLTCFLSCWLISAPAATNTIQIFNFNYGALPSTHIDPVITVGDTVTWVWTNGTHSTTAAPGQLASPQPAAAGGAGGIPFFPPMAGGMGMGGGQGQQQQERERTTWLAEDEDVWGTDPEVTPQVLGRDFADDEDELDAYEEYAEPETESRRAPTRARGR